MRLDNADADKGLGMARAAQGRFRDAVDAFDLCLRRRPDYADVYVEQALAYASLVFDICIAVVTSVRALGIGDFQSLLIPVNYALTAVVVLSAVVLIILLIERAFRRDNAPTPTPAL